MDAEEELGKLLGREIDLVHRKTIERSRNPWRRKNMLGAARVVYTD